MKKKLIGLMMGTALVLAACGGGSDDTKSSETASGGDGQKLYEQKCLGCHGVDLAGGAGPKLKGSSLSKEEIEKIILNGKGAMPKGLFEGEEASKVAEWVSNQK